MNGYKNGKIYKIVGGGLTYYGSTIQTLEKRLIAHKAKYTSFLKVEGDYYSSFEILKLGDYKIELVEAYPCSSKKELELREKHYITSFECCNKCIPGRSKKQWRIDNKDKFLDNQKQYLEVNKEKINERNRLWREANPEKVREIRRIYREANKEVIKQRNAERYQARKIKDIK